MNGVNSFFGLPSAKINPSFFTTNTAGLDPDVSSFISSALITDSVEIDALTFLVKKLKEDGLWSKLEVIYPFIGATSRSHSRNLKDPRDLNSAFRITWNGGVVHSKLGVVLNGVNSFGETNYVVTGITSPYNVTFGTYIIGGLPTNTNTKYILGNFTTSRVIQIPEVWLGAPSRLVARGVGIYGGTISYYENIDAFTKTGSIIGTRPALNNTLFSTFAPMYLYFNGQERIWGLPFGTISFVGTSTTQTIKIGTASTNSPSANLPLSTGYSNATVQFIFWGNNHLNAIEVSDLSKIIEDYQSMLKRSLLRNCNEYIGNQVVIQ